MYTIESLININPVYQENHRFKQTDVDMANKYIEIIENNRTDDKIQVGDIIEFTTRTGDYYRNAHVEKLYPEISEVNICEYPSAPFIFLTETKDNIKCTTSGGAWSNIPNNLKLMGKRKKIFADFGNCGACAHGAVYFEAAVNVWEYKQPDPLYGDFSTKEYDKHYISYCVDSLGNPKNGSIYRYFGQDIAFTTKEDYEAWRDTFKGVEFNGNWPNQTGVFTYKRIEILTTKEKFDFLDLECDTRTQNGTIMVKFQYDDASHTITEYRYTNDGNSLRGVKPYELARKNRMKKI